MNSYVSAFSQMHFHKCTCALSFFEILQHVAACEKASVQPYRIRY